MWLIYCDQNGLFWSNEHGWGCPATATRFQRTGYPIPGASSRWVRSDAPEVRNWTDPDGE